MQTRGAQAMYQASNSKTYTYSAMVEAEAREAEMQKVVDGLQAQLAQIERETTAGGPELRSPMPGTVVAVLAESGEHVTEGRTVVSVEAMKMEHPITATLPGTVTVLVGVGDRVDVWVAMPAEGGRGHADPARLAEALEISEVTAEQNGFGGSGTTRVQLLAPEETLPRIVDAKVKDARVTLVPAHGVR